MSTPRTGGCACGAVRYEVRGPVRPVVACHCESCRRQSGYHVAATAAPAAMLEVTGVENLAAWHATPHATRRFCRICGSHLFWQREGAERVSIMAGSLDAPTGLALSHHIHVAEKGDFYDIADGLPQFEGATPDAFAKEL